MVIGLPFIINSSKAPNVPDPALANNDDDRLRLSTQMLNERRDGCGATNVQCDALPTPRTSSEHHECHLTEQEQERRAPFPLRWSLVVTCRMPACLSLRCKLALTASYAYTTEPLLFGHRQPWPKRFLDQNPGLVRELPQLDRSCSRRTRGWQQQRDQPGREHEADRGPQAADQAVP